MGYRSDFRLVSAHDEETTQAIIEWAKAQTDPDLTFYFTQLFENNYLYDMKWYEHERDMATLSKAFPDEKFIIEVEGEGKDDQWASYSLHGECRIIVASIVWPSDPFEEEA